MPLAVSFLISGYTSSPINMVRDPCLGQQADLQELRLENGNPVIATAFSVILGKAQSLSHILNGIKIF